MFEFVNAVLDDLMCVVVFKVVENDWRSGGIAVYTHVQDCTGLYKMRGD